MPIVMLDSHPLGLISNPANELEPLKCRNRIKQLVNNGILVVIPEIIDYELRRTLFRKEMSNSIQRLDRLQEELGLAYFPITTAAIRKAAELWGWARITGQQTAHGEKIDIDVILAAQSIILAMETGEYTVIATADINDLRRYNVDARRWEHITVEYCLSRGK